jgi:hypothetical protein
MKKHDIFLKFVIFVVKIPLWQAVWRHITR